jgi:hypothetical protein
VQRWWWWWLKQPKSVKQIEPLLCTKFGHDDHATYASRHTNHRGGSSSGSSNWCGSGSSSSREGSSGRGGCGGLRSLTIAFGYVLRPGARGRDQVKDCSSRASVAVDSPSALTVVYAVVEVCAVVGVAVVAGSFAQIRGRWSGHSGLQKSFIFSFIRFRYLM